MERDLCQLEVIWLNRRPVRIVSATQRLVGQRVYAIGTPKGLELTLSEGLISSLRPRARSFVIQTSAPMSRGSSGGGLFDDEGRLVGIAAFQYARGQNLNFAVPASWVTEMPGRVRGAWAKAGLGATAEQPLGARALALMDIGNYEAALQVAREWVQAAPTDALPRHALGLAYSGLKRRMKRSCLGHRSSQSSPCLADRAPPMQPQATMKVHGGLRRGQGRGQSARTTGAGWRRLRCITAKRR